MAHFAEVDENGNVLRVIVVNNSDCGDLPFPESEPIGVAFCKMLFGSETNWVQTSYNSSFRTRYAGIGSKYLAGIDTFATAQPHPSWTLNEFDGVWEAPVPKPEIPNGYTAIWDEENQEWDVVLDRTAV